MALSNYIKSMSRRNGGIRSVALIDQTEVASVTYSAPDKGYSEITLEEGCYFSKYDIREDEAEYREEISVSNGAFTVTHELKFMLDRMGNDSAPAIAAIAEASRNGILALVTTTNGDSYLLGYSSELGKERPLRMSAAAGTTGRQLSDGTSEVITLRSEDITKALPFLGDTGSVFQSA